MKHLKINYLLSSAFLSLFISGSSFANYYDSMVTCSTSSNGYSFVEESFDGFSPRETVKNQCKANGRTNNADCVLNLRCNDYRTENLVITCQTFSNGYKFAEDNRDGLVARDTTKNQCKTHSKTNNADCITNLTCNDNGRNPQITICTTTSNGYKFAEENRDGFVAREAAKQLCISSSRTNNNDCVFNLSCYSVGQSSYPQPTYPQPTYPQPTYPTPVEPRRPTPPRVSCVANRYDPAGMFIQSYSGWSCGDALALCNSELRGRQSCNLAR
jgi:hypothetical protein